MSSRRAALAMLVLSAALPGCRGTIPRRDTGPESGLTALIVAGRVILPAGETREGGLAVNLEGDGGRQASLYRLPLQAERSSLFLIEPGSYRLLPIRSIFGFQQNRIQAVVEGRSVSVPFPREILRRPAMNLRSKKVFALGIIEVRIQTALPGQPPSITARLDDTPAARRAVVQNIIREMMDPNSTLEERDTAILWAKPLDETLMGILSEPERRPIYKPSR